MDAASVRRNGGKDFVSFYNSLCALQNSYPVASISTCARDGVLNCHLHALQRQDLHPLLTALRINTVLHTVVFYNKWQEKAYQHYKDVLHASIRVPKRSVAKQPPSYIVTDVTRAIYQLLTVSSSVKSITLEGVLLSCTNVRQLSKGIGTTSSRLRHLSLKGSFAGDAAISELCKVLRGCEMLEWLDLTCCGLTSKVVPHILAVLRQQSVSRQSSVWKETLRGRRPHYSALPGLRRVTLNLNPGIGDEGACQLAEALREDPWIKGIDLQTCGLSSLSGQAFLDVLPTNSSLMVVDLRDNASIDDTTMESITQYLVVNVSNNSQIDDSYSWLDVETLRMRREFRAAGIPVTRAKKRSAPPPRPSGTKISSKHSTNIIFLSKKNNSTLSRATRCHQKRRPSEVPPVLHGPSVGVASPTHNSDSTSNHSNTLSSSQRLEYSPDKNQTAGTPSSCNGSITVPCMTLTAEQFKVLQDEISSCHARLKQEKRERKKLEDKLLKAEYENEALKKTLEELQANTISVRTEGMNPAVDSQTLADIESTFKQFHSFLDFLSQNGYGHLTSALETQ